MPEKISIELDKSLKEALNDMEIENHILSDELIEKLATRPGIPNWEELERIKSALGKCPALVILGKRYG